MVLIEKYCPNSGLRLLIRRLLENQDWCLGKTGRNAIPITTRQTAAER